MASQDEGGFLIRWLRGTIPGVELFSNPKEPPINEALEELQTELGEAVVYCSAGRFLTSQGVGSPPLDHWGLIALTPTRVFYRHYSHSHPLLGFKDKEVTWSIHRTRFSSCTAFVQNFWKRLFSSTPNHIQLEGTDTQLLIEVIDDPGRFPLKWNESLVPLTNDSSAT